MERGFVKCCNRNFPDSGSQSKSSLFKEILPNFIPRGTARHTPQCEELAEPGQHFEFMPCSNAPSHLTILKLFGIYGIAKSCTSSGFG